MAHARQWARNGDSTTSRRRIDTPRNAPSDAAAERALLFTPAVPRHLVGPHAWSRARVDRLAPRKEPKPSGRGQPFHTALRAASPFPSPKKVICWGPGGALAARRSWPHALNSPLGPRDPLLIVLGACGSRSHEHLRELLRQRSMSLVRCESFIWVYANFAQARTCRGPEGAFAGQCSMCTTGQICSRLV